MIEPIRPGDDLFPFDVETVGGKERLRRKEGWSDRKQIALNIHTIDYLLQFDRHRGSPGLINMIEVYADRAARVGDEQQKMRYREFLAIRDKWLQDRPAA